MDEGLRRLEREAAARPGDEQGARRYERALERAGQREALRRRYTFKFLCPLRFEELTPTKDPLVRSCDRCRKSVHFVRTPEELADRVATGSCVAFERRTLAPAIDLVVDDPRTHSAAERRRPCVVATDMTYVDLDLVEVDGEVLDAVSYEVASTYWVFRVPPVSAHETARPRPYAAPFARGRGGGTQWSGSISTKSSARLKLGGRRRARVSTCPQHCGRRQSTPLECTERPRLRAC